MADPRLRRALAAGALLLIGAAAFVWAVARSERLPRGPEPVAWSRVSCERCRMLVSEPAFAGQLQTTDGSVYHFDDPGCLLLWTLEERPDVHAVYFHHHTDDRWLPRDRVRFAPADPTPMGYGLAAVEAGEGRGGRTLSYDEGISRALERDAARTPGAMR